MKSSERKKRRAYLQDFEKNAAGRYEYIGAAYAYADGDRLPRKLFLLRLIVCSALAAASVALMGTIRAPGMDNSPFVLLPYAVCVIAMLVLLWATVGICFAGDPIREYKHERCVLHIMRRAVVFAVAEALCAIGEIVCIAVNGVGDHLFGAIAFFVLCAVGAVSSLFAGKTIASAKWTKINKKSRLEK